MRLLSKDLPITGLRVVEEDIADARKFFEKENETADQQSKPSPDQAVSDVPSKPRTAWKTSPSSMPKSSASPTTPTTSKEDSQQATGAIGGIVSVPGSLNPTIVGSSRAYFPLERLGIREIDLQRISEKLGDEWEKLAMTLGLLQPEVEHIKRDYTGTQNQIFTMLLRWRRQSTSTDQREVLHTALKEVGWTDIATAQAAGLVRDNIQEMQGDEDKLRRLLFESGSGELKTTVVCKSNKDLQLLSFYLRHATAPLEAEQFDLHVSKEELPLLRQILACDRLRVTVGIVVNYYLSEQGKEELSDLQTTLYYVDKKHQLYIRVWIEPRSLFDARHVSEDISHMAVQIGSVGLAMVRRSPEEVVRQVEALKGCRLHDLVLHDTDLHAQLWPPNRIPLSLALLELTSCSLVDDDMSDLTMNIGCIHGLVGLDLGGNTFSLDAVQALTHCLQRLHRLRHLYLNNIGLDAEKVRGTISQNLPHLKEKQEGVFQA